MIGQFLAAYDLRLYCRTGLSVAVAFIINVNTVFVFERHRRSTFQLRGIGTILGFFGVWRAFWQGSTGTCNIFIWSRKSSIVSTLSEMAAASHNQIYLSLDIGCMIDAADAAA